MDKNLMLEILKVATRAPSSHNTQPWTVHITSNDALTIGYDTARQLNVGDPTKRELFISLGCFIESIMLVAAEKNLVATYTYISPSNTNVASITFLQASSNEEPGYVPRDRDWSELIVSRRSDKRYFETKPLSDNDAKSLVAQTRLSSGTNVRLQLFGLEDDKSFISDMTREATLAIMSKQDFRDELAHWIRNNWTKKADGMPGYTQGIPGPISLLAPLVIKKNKGTATDQANKDAARVLHSAAVGLICLPRKNGPQDWVEAGRAYQRLCLEAQRLGLRTSAVSAAIIEPHTTQQIIERFGLANEPVALLRFGYANNKPVRATPRRSATDLLV